MVVFKAVHVGRTEAKAGLVLTCIHTRCTINDPDMWLFADVKTVQEKLVFNFNAHLTLLIPSHAIRNILEIENSPFIFFQIALCLAFLDTPSTVSISRAAKLDSLGRRVKSS